jgi:hypothetical protein
MTGNTERWKQAAEALGLGVPEERVEALAPVLEALLTAARKSLDRDLSQVEPVTVFRPQRERGEAA